MKLSEYVYQCICQYCIQSEKMPRSVPALHHSKLRVVKVASRPADGANLRDGACDIEMLAFLDALHGYGERIVEIVNNYVSPQYIYQGLLGSQIAKDLGHWFVVLRGEIACMKQTRDELYKRLGLWDAKERALVEKWLDTSFEAVHPKKEESMHLVQMFLRAHLCESFTFVPFREAKRQLDELTQQNELRKEEASMISQPAGDPHRSAAGGGVVEKAPRLMEIGYPIRVSSHSAFVRVTAPCATIGAFETSLSHRPPPPATPYVPMVPRRGTPFPTITGILPATVTGSTDAADAAAVAAATAAAVDYSLMPPPPPYPSGGKERGGQ